MTAATRTCPTCNNPIPAGALYCLQCGASSPTEVGGEPAGTTVHSDIESRRVLMQTALGRAFDVQGLVGKGGFGEVWAATDVELGREVAVKVLHASLAASHEYRERFRREARAIARLRHPGIVPIYHVGESAGLVYFIMPLVRGVTLKSALTEPMGVEEAVRILLECAAALREAHAQGIVHRDLKPENIMLEGAQRRVLIMDFGVAKMEDASSNESLTEADMVVGSPEYMSPEQATGRELDARSDIYSLGVVAYRMLAGRLPFRAATPREVLAHHVLSTPDPIDDHAKVPESLSDAVMRCLAKDPGQRWQSAEEFHKALTSTAPRRSVLAAQAPRPVATVAEKAAPPPPAAAAAAPPRRSVAGKAGLVAALLVLAAIWPFLSWRASRAAARTAARVVALYNVAADSIGALSAAFASRDVAGPQYVALREELLVVTDERIDEAWGAAIDDSARWPEVPRLAVQDAARRARASGLAVTPLTLRLSDVVRCTRRTSGDTVTIADELTGDNCWWQAAGARELTEPLEYYARFTVPARPRADAGAGVAWCRSDGDCRVAFLWPGSGLVWGAHRPHRGLNALQTGAATLSAGDHELRVRYQDGALRFWLDGGLVMERRSTSEAAFLERPASVHFVVQNTSVQLLDGALAAVGRQP